MHGEAIMLCVKAIILFTFHNYATSYFASDQPENTNN